ncbi:DUF1799 domain-containing protein [Pseudomonas sp. PDM13]|nr:DUF1799 domain-containing protein [Pseudomonas sp. PDM13]
MGLTLADIPEETLQVYPENWDAFRVFETMRTQWRTGMCGATGLDYTAIPAVFDLLNIPADRRQLFGDLRVMEFEALDVMAEQRIQESS